MKFKNLFLLAVIGAILASGVWVIAQNGEEMTEEQKKMMELMTKYGSPGEHHKLLEHFAGEWDLTTKYWTAPDTEPQESQATASSEWVLGGRYLMEKVAGTMMGSPFHGISILGYDSYAEQYNTLWIDEMSTMFFLQSGSCNEDGTVFTFEGTYDDYLTGRKDIKQRTITTIIDGDKHISKMYNPAPDGSEYMNLEIIYTRKK